jgi:hypothetical protein
MKKVIYITYRGKFNLITYRECYASDINFPTSDKIQGTPVSEFQKWTDEKNINHLVTKDMNFFKNLPFEYDLERIKRTMRIKNILNEE